LAGEEDYGRTIRNPQHFRHRTQLSRHAGAGIRRFRFKEGSPLKGIACTNDINYQDIVPNRRVVLASAMTLGEKCISASPVTIDLLPSETGTDLILTHQGAFFEGADGPEMREAGWRKLLEQLTGELPR
jgi:uncharacterized protein YndB with AHSA1/START domain